MNIKLKRIYSFIFFCLFLMPSASLFPAETTDTCVFAEPETVGVCPFDVADPSEKIQLPSLPSPQKEPTPDKDPELTRLFNQRAIDIEKLNENIVTMEAQDILSKIIEWSMNWLPILGSKVSVVLNLLIAMICFPWAIFNLGCCPVGRIAPEPGDGLESPGDSKWEQQGPWGPALSECCMPMDEDACKEGFICPKDCKICFDPEEFLGFMRAQMQTIYNEPDSLMNLSISDPPGSGWELTVYIPDSTHTADLPGGKSIHGHFTTRIILVGPKAVPQQLVDVASGIRGLRNAHQSRANQDPGRYSEIMKELNNKEREFLDQVKQLSRTGSFIEPQTSLDSLDRREDMRRRFEEQIRQYPDEERRIRDKWREAEALFTRNVESMQKMHAEGRVFPELFIEELNGKFQAITFWVRPNSPGILNVTSIKDLRTVTCDDGTQLTAWQDAGLVHKAYTTQQLGFDRLDQVQLWRRNGDTCLPFEKLENKVIVGVSSPRLLSYRFKLSGDSADMVYGLPSFRDHDAKDYLGLQEYWYQVPPFGNKNIIMKARPGRKPVIFAQDKAGNLFFLPGPDAGLRFGKGYPAKGLSAGDMFDFWRPDELTGLSVVDSMFYPRMSADGLELLQDQQAFRDMVEQAKASGLSLSLWFTQAVFKNLTCASGPVVERFEASNSGDRTGSRYSIDVSGNKVPVVLGESVASLNSLMQLDRFVCLEWGQANDAHLGEDGFWGVKPVPCEQVYDMFGGGSDLSGTFLPRPDRPTLPIIGREGSIFLMLIDQIYKEMKGNYQSARGGSNHWEYAQDMVTPGKRWWYVADYNQPMHLTLKPGKKALVLAEYEYDTNSEPGLPKHCSTWKLSKSVSGDGQENFASCCSPVDWVEEKTIWCPNGIIYHCR